MIHNLHSTLIPEQETSIPLANGIMKKDIKFSLIKKPNRRALIISTPTHQDIFPLDKSVNDNQLFYKIEDNRLTIGTKTI